MSIDRHPKGERGVANGLMPQTLRVQRIWIDGRDRWVSMRERRLGFE